MGELLFIGSCKSVCLLVVYLVILIFSVLFKYIICSLWYVMF